MGFICPEYKTIKSQITSDINKKVLLDETKIDEIPNELKYYKTVRNENYMIFKNPNLIIFHSSFQEKLFMKYTEDIFVDSTFYIVPKFTYQVFNKKKIINNFIIIFFFINY